MNALRRFVPAVVIAVSACHATEPRDTGSADAGQSPDASYLDASMMIPDSGTPEASDGGDAGTAPPADGGTLDGGGLSWGDGGFVLPSGRVFPDTYGTIAILADQLPDMTSAQMTFAASHYVGTQKQLLPVTQQLRALNPNFLVLHYHLAMWQSAPDVDFIVSGTSWGNDYPTVTQNESWFWHNTESQRVTSNADGKLLMNVSVAGFQQYWAESLATEVADGDYDAIFLDSASPALLQGECSTAANGSTADPRLAGTAARDTMFPDLNGMTWIEAWQSWIQSLSTTLAAEGIPLIPNTSAFITGWDNTNYFLTPGIFAEGFAGTDFAESDGEASTNTLLQMAADDKIMILQNYLSDSSDVATRMYYLGNYLLVKGHHTYLDYFASGPLEWYPEWSLELGEPVTTGMTVSDLASDGVYRRDFENGSVLVNPSGSPVTVELDGGYEEVVPMDGGAVDSNGDTPGTLSMQPVSSITVGATTAAVIIAE